MIHSRTEPHIDPYRRLQSKALAKAQTPIAWNDIEALPVYAAMLLCFTCAALAISDSTPTIYATILKAVGIIGGVALRSAWLQLDAADGVGDA